MNTPDSITRARDYAIEAHARLDQRRKYTGQPYQEHLQAVVRLVAEVTDDPVTLAAAWLHDTVEDTTATFGDIERAFGAPVARMVAELSDISRPADGNRAVRKAMDLQHLAQASHASQTIKLADLIDNCRDICRHDPAFGRVYLVEAANLLGVLTRGDARLYRRAQRTVADGARQLGLPAPQQTLPAGEPPDPVPTAAAHAHRLARRLFTSAFVARDITEPLRSFDADHAAAEAGAVLRQRALSVAGVRRDGIVAGYVRTAQLPEDDPSVRLATLMRPLAPSQLLHGDSPLSAVVGVLTRYDFCFVTTLGEVGGFITRHDIQKPAVRMWLFGIVTFIEMDLAARIRTVWPDGCWTQRLSPSRLAKAQLLLQERQRRGQHPDLVDCLQLGDKATIVTADATELARLGFATKGAAQRVMRDLESLRNNLAHAQDIVTHDWPQIARLAQRVEEAVTDH